MDGIAKQGDIVTPPRRKGNRGPDVYTLQCRRVGEFDQFAHVWVPTEGQEEGQLFQTLTIHRRHVRRQMLSRAPQSPADAVVIPCAEKVGPAGEEGGVCASPSKLQGVDDGPK